MGVPRIAARARNILIQRGEFQAGAGCKLADRAPVYLLPGRLIRHRERLQRASAPHEFAFVHEDVQATRVEIDAYAITCFQQSKTTTDGRLRRSIQDRGTARCAALTPVADTW